jgi:hypothetical protein
MTLIRKKVTRRFIRLTKLLVFAIVFILTLTITFSDVYGATF